MAIVRAPGAAVLLGLALLIGSCTDEGDDGPVVVPQQTTEPSSPATSRTPKTTQPPTPNDEPAVPRVADTIATDLTSPWDVVFLPDGDALVSERDTGVVKRIAADGGVETVGEIPAAEPSLEGGLLGLAVHPDYPDQPWLYAYYSTTSDNRVVRLRYPPGGSFGPEEVVIDGIPSSEIHNGGRIAFGPDGMLYVTTGDGSNGEVSQDRSSLGGKILRLTPDGDPAPGNPFDSPVWTYGHRNVQGIAWDDKGRLYASEFGQNTWDELNLIEEGNNYGWPQVEGASDQDAEFTDPLVQWRPDEASPSGIAYAEGAIWMTGLNGERLWRIDVEDDGRVVGEPEAFFVGEFGRLRDVEAAPDGSLWLVTSNTDGRGDPADEDDRILRLELR